MFRYVGLLMAIAWLWPSPLHAEKAPASTERLQQEAMAIVVATIERIRIESEPAEFENGSSNMDWGIYLALAIETVEKGSIPEKNIEARCFRIKYRASLSEYMTPTGHAPIPRVGTQVRVYLAKTNDGWGVLLPNGIEPLSDDAKEASEIVALRSRTYTYFLPVEVWFLLAIAVVASLILRMVLRRGRKAQHLQENDSPKTGNIRDS